MWVFWIYFSHLKAQFILHDTHKDSNLKVNPTYTWLHESDIIKKLIGPKNRGGGERAPKPPRITIKISIT